MKYFLLLLPLFILMTSCKNGNKDHHTNDNLTDQNTLQDQKKSGDNSNALKPSTVGDFYNIIVFGDNVETNKTLQTSLDSILIKPVNGLPQREMIYFTNYINCDKISQNLKKNSKIIILNNHSETTKVFINENLPEIADDNNPMQEILNKWATPQTVIYLQASSDEELIKSFKENKRQILSKFNLNTKRKISTLLYESGRLSKYKKHLEDDHNLTVNIPSYFRLVKELLPGINDDLLIKKGIEKLLWVRGDTKDATSNILIYQIKYDEKVTKDIGEFFKVKTLVNTLVDGEEKSSKMYVDSTYFNYYVDKITIYGKPAFKIRGIWAFDKEQKGGPFVTYMIPDQVNNRIIFVDGFVYAPETKKKPYIHRLEVIAETTRIDQYEK